MKIIVNPKNYTNFEYDTYCYGGTPENNPYVVGQVVVIPNENCTDPNKFVLAVVLGVMTKDEVRTDMHGMVAIDNIRPATIDDFGKSNITYLDPLCKECRGFKVSRNHDTFEWTIEEPNF